MNTAALPTTTEPDDLKVVPAPILRPISDWVFDGFVLRTIHKTCTCGERHISVELYEHHTAIGRILSTDQVMSRYIPYRKTRLPLDAKLTHVTCVEPLAICPKCFDRFTPTVMPAIDEVQWRATLQKKARELKELRTGKPTPPTPGELFDNL